MSAAAFHAPPRPAARRPSRRRPLAPPRAVLLAACQGPGEARARVVDAFMPLIGAMARLYRGSVAVDRAELMQEGIVGLLRALARYDPELGTPFWPYASWWVRQAMQQLVSELARPVVLSDRAVRQLARVKEARDGQVRRGGREPTSRELARATGMAVEQVEHLLVAERRPRALEERVRGADDAGATYGELLADPGAEDAYERIATAIDSASLAALLDELGDRERLVVSARYGLDGDEQTLRQLGATLGVSVERVRQIEERALGKLRVAAAAC